VEPAASNSNSHGHTIRQYLILACTQVESTWRSFLKVHGESKDKLSTSDYVRIAGPLHLAEWRVCLTLYPDYPTIKPYANWDVVAPTKSLPWYDAYNRTKHDLQANLCEAKLEHAISATAALYVMLAAQFGPNRLTNHPVGKFFSWVETPTWLPQELYWDVYGQWNIADCLDFRRG